jgi:Trk-type K+ transport system membrane component
LPSIIQAESTIPFHSRWLKALVVVVVFILGALSYPYVTPLIIELLKKSVISCPGRASQCDHDAMLHILAKDPGEKLAKKAKTK